MKYVSTLRLESQRAVDIPNGPKTEISHLTFLCSSQLRGSMDERKTWAQLRDPFRNMTLARMVDDSSSLHGRVVFGSISSRAACVPSHQAHGGV